MNRIVDVVMKYECMHATEIKKVWWRHHLGGVLAWVHDMRQLRVVIIREGAGEWNINVMT